MKRSVLSLVLMVACGGTGAVSTTEEPVSTTTQVPSTTTALPDPTTSTSQTTSTLAGVPTTTVETTPTTSPPEPKLGEMAIDYFIASEAICIAYSGESGNPLPDPARFTGVVAQAILDNDRVLIKDGVGYLLIVDFGANPTTIYSSAGPTDSLPFDLSFGCPPDLFLGSVS